MTAEEAASLDLNTISGFSAEELAAGLKGELANLAEDFVLAEQEYGVNAVFLAALAAHESGWGKHCFKPNNIFGWSGKSFDSKSECIAFVASRIAEKYLSEDGRCFHGKNLYGVNVSYNGSTYSAGKNTFIATIVDLQVPAGTGTATFTIGCPNVWNGQNVTILHQKSDGSFENIKPDSVEDNKVTFTMTSYSPVAIVIDLSNKSPKTGDIFALVAAMAAVSGIGAAVCGRKAKKN